MNTCDGSAAADVIHLSVAGGLSIGLALIVIGILISQGLTFWITEEDERIAAEHVADEDQALKIATEVMAPYPGSVPAQRVTNGEDLLRDGDSR